MRKVLMILTLITSLFIMVGCKNTAPAAEPTAKETESVTQAPTEVTTNPFEFESEIDFSDFETQPEVTEEPSQPEQTQKPTEPTVKPTEPVVKPTNPVTAEPDVTEYEETQAPTTTTPSIGDDGYNNQIVRP